ncbi:MAG TPA: ATP synthase F1 subunit delta [Prolixibacteraceae bacterium]|nr:ATP synthase F1 subunit delta [Prolixibacteraceae bacterium]
MDEGKIAVRYAKALLGLAKEKQVEEAVKTDMEMIHQLFETMPGFDHVLTSPVIGGKEKRALFENVFAKKINALTYSFLMLLITNNREGYLKDITRNFHDTYRKEAGYKAAKLISAFEIDSATIDQFRALIRKLYKTEVDLTFNVDNTLIGGFVLQVEDQQIDASVAAKLKKLKRELLASRN